MKTTIIATWETWKRVCEERGIDPWEEIEFSIDEGGGNSRDFEYIGDVPEKERVAEDWIAGDPYWPESKKEE